MTPETTPLSPKYLQQEESVSQELKNFISTLPKQKGWGLFHLYQYQGFWYNPRCLQGLLSCQKHFQPQDSDIFLVTHPKSGTTWLKALLFTLVNRNRYPINKNHPLLNANPHYLVPYLEMDLYADNENPDLCSLQPPRLFSSHLPSVSLPEVIRSKCKIVYLCRNPKDSLVSLWYHINKFRLQHEMGPYPIMEVFDSFCTGISLYGSFWDHVLEYWKQSKENPGRILFLRYEDMKNHSEIHLQRMSEFLDCPFSKEEEESGLADEILKLCSFKSLSSLEVNRNGKLSNGMENNILFRRGEIGDWKNHLSDEIARRIDQITKEKFSGSGLEFINL